MQTSLRAEVVMQKFYCDVCDSEKASGELIPMYVIVDSYCGRTVYDIGKEVCKECSELISKRLGDKIAALRGGE